MLCCRCGIEKPSSFFYRCKYDPSGYRQPCRACLVFQTDVKQAADGILRKECLACHQHKPLEDFVFIRGYRHDRGQPCKACQANKARQLRDKDRITFNAKARAYYATHREQHRMHVRAYKAGHKEEIRAYNQIYHAEHKDDIHARNSAWISANPEKVQAIQKRRRARRANAPTNDLTAAQWREIKIAYGYRCVYCGRKMKRLTQDHIAPLSKGGSHTVSNVVPACSLCNSRKRNGPPLIPVQPLLFTLAPPKEKKRLMN